MVRKISFTGSNTPPDPVLLLAKAICNWLKLKGYMLLPSYDASSL
jgi:hypothetical protein